MLVSSVKPPDEIYGSPYQWIPSRIVLSNFVDAWTSFPFTRYLFNTIFITITAMTGAVISITMTAYAIARIRFPLANLFFALVIAAMLLPGEVTFIPQFIIWSDLGFVNTYVPLIAPSWLARGEAKIFLLRQFFRSMPSALDDAAKIDGASVPQRFTSIAIPNAKAPIAIVLVLEFVVNWNKFIDPLIYLNDASLYTLNVGLNMFREVNSAGVYGVSELHLFMAIATVILMPILILFLFLQRYFVEGINISGYKG